MRSSTANVCYCNLLFVVLCNMCLCRQRPVAATSKCTVHAVQRFVVAFWLLTFKCCLCAALIGCFMLTLLLLFLLVVCCGSCCRRYLYCLVLFAFLLYHRVYCFALRLFIINMSIFVIFSNSCEELYYTFVDQVWKFVFIIIFAFMWDLLCSHLYGDSRNTILFCLCF